MTELELDRIWDANEASTRIQVEQGAGQQPDPVDVAVVDASMNSYALAQSQRGDDAETLCLRALYAIDELPAAETTQAESTEVEPTEPAEDFLPDQQEEAATRVLIQQFREGDPEAAQALIAKYESFIWQHAKRLAPPGRYTSVDSSDLFQEGTLGLLDFAGKCDLELVNKFFSYAGQRIINKMNAYVLKHRSNVYVPKDVATKIDGIRNENQRRYQLRRPPLSDEEAIDRYDINGELITVDVVRRADLLTYAIGSIDDSPTPVRDSSPGNEIVMVESKPLESLTADLDPEADYSVLEEGSKEALEGALDKLNERERQIVRKRFGLETGRYMTLDEVGLEHNLSRSRIGQIEAEALAKLRDPYHKSKLQEILQ